MVSIGRPKTHNIFQWLATATEPTWKPTRLTRYRCRRLRNPLWWVKLLRTLLMSECFLLAWHSSWRWSFTKDWNSALQASTVDPFSHPHVTKPSRSCPKRKKAEWSSPPIMISGQKQLTPWPSFDRAATVDKTVLVNSSRNRPALFLNSFFRYWLVIFSSAACTRVLTRKCSSPIAAKGEWFRSM